MSCPGRALATLIALAALILSATARSQPDRPLVRTDAGQVRGEQAGGVNVFRGMPYAQPPVGDLRWRPPQAVQPWKDVREAREFGAACNQPPRNANNRRQDGLAAAPEPQSEDCLSINIWSADLKGKAPVMVWLHGGAHRFGASSLPFYDGAALARQGVVLASFNYRLGLFGYFAHPTLTAAAGEEPIGNYGLMDQLAALQWVRRNIAAFGGDPSNVTVFGESAGGASILYLLSTSAAEGLFAKAIVESGGGWQRSLTLAQKESEGAKAVASVGAGGTPTVAQLRALSVDQLNRAIEVAPLLNFGPFIDGRLVTASPAQRFRDARAIDVPLIIGWNSYEASLIDATGAAPASLLSVFPAPQLQRLRELYPTAGSDEALARAVFTDASFGAPARWIAERAHSGASSWLYHFDYTLEVRRQSPGANHGAEIAYVFGTLDAIPALRPLISARDRSVADAMSARWVAFAKSGRPDSANGPSWPAYEPGADALLKFGVPTEVLRGFRKDALEYQTQLFKLRPEAAP